MLCTKSILCVLSLYILVLGPEQSRFGHRGCSPTFYLSNVLHFQKLCIFLPSLVCEQLRENVQMCAKYIELLSATTLPL